MRVASYVTSELLDAREVTDRTRDRYFRLLRFALSLGVPINGRGESRQLRRARIATLQAWKYEKTLVTRDRRWNEALRRARGRS